ncbi:MAG: 2-amino-4-hydroxy-6-hydroxymethyldihydropteridine diphosphokinase [Patescibacteria group bacterium]
MTTVYLALGSNVGDSRHYVEAAVKQLSKLLKDINKAPLYTSKAVGYTDQADFLNTAVSGQTDLEPLELLKAIKAIEQSIGRVPTFRWGPREIDIDIIFYGDLHMETELLTIPHSSCRERDFVLRPICDLNPSLIDPISSQSVSELLAHIDAQQESILKRVE